MTERKVEEKIIAKISAALSAAGIDGIDVIGAWETVADGDVKGLEDRSARGYVSVKAAPRSFSVYTQSDGEIPVAVALNVRAELDSRGVGFVDITRVLSGVLYAWHKSFSLGESDFSIENEFIFTGARLDGGDCGMDRERCVWTWMQSLSVQGVFLK